MPRFSPYVAGGLSLLFPGLGQLYNQEYPEGIAICCISAGILGGMAVALAGPPAFRSGLTPIMLGCIYPFVLIPAVIDAYQRAVGAAAPLLSGHQRWYVILMLLAVGPMALPLLWQGARFSRAAKIAWTVAVVGIALASILLVVAAGPALERFQAAHPELQELLR